MIIVAGYVAVLLSVLLTGGRLAGLATVRVRRPWALVVALGMQIVVVNVVEHRVAPALGSAVHLASYAVAFAFLWWNRRMTGIVVIVAGGLANLAAIAGNGGVMPATEAALRAAGRPVVAGAFQNSAASAGSPLWFLGDVFAWPAPLPLANVFSVGDVLLLLGVAITTHGACDTAVARAFRTIRLRRELGKGGPARGAGPVRDGSPVREGGRVGPTVLVAPEDGDWGLWVFRILSERAKAPELIVGGRDVLAGHVRRLADEGAPTVLVASDDLIAGWSESDDRAWAGLHAGGPVLVGRAARGPVTGQAVAGLIVRTTSSALPVALAGADTADVRAARGDHERTAAVVRAGLDRLLAAAGGPNALADAVGSIGAPAGAPGDPASDGAPRSRAASYAAGS